MVGAAAGDPPGMPPAQGNSPQMSHCRESVPVVRRPFPLRHPMRRGRGSTSSHSRDLLSDFGTRAGELREPFATD